MKKELLGALARKNQQLRLVLSPPRTGSTMLASSLGRARTAYYGEGTHEPFINLKRDPRDLTSGYTNLMKISNSQPEGHSLILKEMSHWLFIGDTYREFLELMAPPVLVLIRNPILNVESRMRKILQTMELRAKPSVVSHLGGERTDIETDTQRKLIDLHAQQHGYETWQEMVDHAHVTGDYRMFEEFIDIPDVMDDFGFGWESLNEQVQFMDGKGIEYQVIDCTEYRSNPWNASRMIADGVGLEYTPEMVSWGDEIDITTGQVKPHQTIWYQRLNNSNGVLPPTEVPTTLGYLPGRLKSYVQETAMPIYSGLARSTRRIRYPESRVDVTFDISSQSRLSYHEDKIPLWKIDPIASAHMLSNGYLTSDLIEELAKRYPEIPTDMIHNDEKRF